MNRGTLSHRTSALIMVGLLASSLLFGASHIVQAKTNSTWQFASTVRTPLSGQILYGTLSQPGASSFFQFTTARAGRVDITLTVPTWTNDRFQPQLVLYQPDAMTAGPILPMEQPSETLASVYPSTTGATLLDPATLTMHRQVQKTSLLLPTAGRYYLAVYNAGSAGGRWRLAFGSRPKFVDLFHWPGQCWQDQAWAGWNLQTLFIPLFVLAVAAAMIMRLHQQPKSKQKPQPRKRKKL